jgi:vitamin B12 transporter
MALKILLFFTSSLGSAVAMANAAPPEPPIIVTGTGIAQPRDASGQAISLIDAATIDRLQPVTVADLLLITPSVRVNSTGGIGSVTGLSLRGAEIGQTVVILDGVRVNDPSSPSDATDFGNLLTANLRSIEVMRGANAVPYGSEAVGGVIALSTLDPAAPEGWTGSALAEAGSYETFRARAGVGWKGERVHAGLGASWLSSAGISSAATRFGATEADGVENLTLNGRLDVDLGASAGLELRAGHIRAALDYDSFFGGPADSADESDFSQTTLHGTFRFAALDGRLNSRASLTLLDNARDYRFTPGTSVDFGYRGGSWRAEYQGILSAGKSTRIIAGYSHVAPDYRFFGFGSDERHSATSNGVHGQVLIAPSSRLNVTAGARHDWHSAFGGVTTFGANANWAAGDGRTRLRAAFGQGFRAPSLYQLYDTFSGNAALKPERSDSIDVGVDHELADGRATIALTVFQRLTRNQIDYDLTTFSYANLARTRSRGLELELRMRPAPGWDVTGSYSLVDARDRSPGSSRFDQRLPRRALHGLALAVDHRWGNGPSLGATLRLSSEAVDPLAPNRQIGGYALVDLRASLPLTQHIELVGRIENAGDRQYETAYGYGRPGRTASLGARLAL